ncbi:MAG: YjbQ family protein [Actinomycetota bacterium]
MDTKVVEIRTRSAPTVVDLTEEVNHFCAGKGDGLLNVFAPHATAGLALIETGSGAEHDLLFALESLLPRSQPWEHRHGSPGHGADHVLPALISPSLTIPVVAGRPALGRWQSVVLVDPNRDNLTRQVRLTFLAG